MEEIDLWQYERQALAEGHVHICGCDEAGAGPLAGPVYAAAVILPMGADIPGRRLQKADGEAAGGPVPRHSDHGPGLVGGQHLPQEIDETDILTARMRCMQLAIDGLSLPADFALVDGNRDHGRGGGVNYAPPMHCKGRQPVSLHRSGIHFGQGEPGPLHAGDGQKISPIRL